MAIILTILDEDPELRLAMREAIAQNGHQLVSAANLPEALQRLGQDPVDLLIADYEMPGVSGLELLRLFQGEGHTTPLLMLIGRDQVGHAETVIRAGAIGYVAKPGSSEQISIAIVQALELSRLRRETEQLRRELGQIRAERQIVGENGALKRALQTVVTAAPTRATVLIQGESGTGKELFARVIHDLSDRSEKPFIKFNCAVLPEDLVESALFGHEKSASSGALKRVAGAFERADGGTLLLDEISELRLELQGKVLRVLQSQDFERVGGHAPVRVDVRVIATTNRDLAVIASDGRFREDLFYRLNVIPIYIPPLREREQDIPLLAHRFAQRTAEQAGREFHGLAPDALEMLERDKWPGNVRELQHVVERAVVLNDGALLQASSFNLKRSHELLNSGENEKPAASSTAGRPWLELPSFKLADAEMLLIWRALKATNDNRTHAAALLGISVRTLRSKLNGTDHRANHD